MWVLAPVGGCVTLSIIITCLSSRWCLIRKIGWSYLGPCAWSPWYCQAPVSTPCRWCPTPPMTNFREMVSSQPQDSHMSDDSCILPHLYFTRHGSARSKLVCSLWSLEGFLNVRARLPFSLDQLNHHFWGWDRASVIFLPVLLRYNWQIELYVFKVYKVTVWCIMKGFPPSS